MGKRKDVYLKCEIEEIPGETYTTNKEWMDWCKSKGIFSLTDSRRGWWENLKVYINDARYIIYLRGIPVQIVNNSELFDLVRSKFDIN